MREAGRRLAERIGERLDAAMGLMVLCLLLFALGIYPGALITVRHAERREALNSACIEQMEELNAVALSLYEDTAEVNGRMKGGDRGDGKPAEH